VKYDISDVFMSSLLHELSSGQIPNRGTRDDDDDRDDEHSGENEASIRELDENTETPEEFSVDDEDKPPQPEDAATQDDE
jgi:hypothetical protein